ncbi:AbrB/MazE/SpoVT family DNA-binding domain-containing protein [Aureimonas glaciei]|uniref:Multidrug transporter MatE n=1 Tax=Aureimonas glaciei TaxID=1776957 RepID=A0A916XV11_9HYPH|nr:AbrB/MazE/SpoVT family DNA-binding domain-containing protein [Aureimonas glaciei]GGD12637.1 multidrug transporter MatE [Aureimonas glaciei]
MLGTVTKWGNSLAVRLPSAFAREAGIHDGKSVNISIHEGSVVITPVDEVVEYDLAKLLAGITPDNLHDETSTGAFVGNEF